MEHPSNFSGRGEVALALVEFDITNKIAVGSDLGNERAFFAGCGIVADSDPQREWDESRIKLRAVGNALGWIDEVSA